MANSVFWLATRWADIARSGLQVLFPQTLFAEVQAGARTFSFANYFRDNKRIFGDFSGGMKLEDEKTESVNENKNKQMLIRFQNTLCNNK